MQSSSTPPCVVHAPPAGFSGTGTATYVGLMTLHSPIWFLKAKYSRLRALSGIVLHVVTLATRFACCDDCATVLTLGGRIGQIIHSDSCHLVSLVIKQHHTTPACWHLPPNTWQSQHHLGCQHTLGAAFPWQSQHHLGCQHTLGAAFPYSPLLHSDHPSAAWALSNSSLRPRTWLLLQLAALRTLHPPSV